MFSSLSGKDIDILQIVQTIKLLEFNGLQLAISPFFRIP